MKTDSSFMLCIKQDCLQQPFLFTEAINLMPHIQCPPIHLLELQNQLNDKNSLSYQFFRTNILYESSKRISEYYDKYIQQIKDIVIELQKEMKEQYAKIEQKRRIYYGIIENNIELISQKIKEIDGIVNPSNEVKSAYECIQLIESEIESILQNNDQTEELQTNREKHQMLNKYIQEFQSEIYQLKQNEKRQQQEIDTLKQELIEEKNKQNIKYENQLQLLAKDNIINKKPMAITNIKKQIELIKIQNFDEIQLLNQEQKDTVKEIQINLNSFQIKDISPILYLNELKSLQSLEINLKFNQIKDIAALAHLKSLKNLQNLNIFLSSNWIKDIAPISNFKELRNLQNLQINLKENMIQDIAPLSHLSELQNLQSLNICLKFNQIKDISTFSHLKDLKNLQTLEINLNDNPTVNYEPKIRIWFSQVKNLFIY